jgi:hypothetical protein
MREQLEAIKTRAVQLELMVRGAAQSDIIASGEFGDALAAMTSELADGLIAMTNTAEQDDASEEGHPIAA